MYIMERARSLPQEIIDILPEGCVDCPVAWQNIMGAQQIEEKHEEPVTKPIEMAREIRAHCSGWKDRDSLPHKIGTAVDPAEVLPEVYEQNCEYSRGISKPA
jgi:hypothetical protein